MLKGMLFISPHLSSVTTQYAKICIKTQHTKIHITSHHVKINITINYANIHINPVGREIHSHCSRHRYLGNFSGNGCPSPDHKQE